MAMRDLARSAAKVERRIAEQEERSSEAFAQRIASQQLLKHHAPLLAAFVESGGASGNLTEPGEFVEKAKVARSLAVKIAAYSTGRRESEIEMSDARHFRLEAAEVVAHFWERGKPFDVDAFAREVATVVGNADAVYDAELVEWSKITRAGSMTLTALGVATSLATSVELYDFRMGRRLVLSTITSAVVEAAKEAVETMAHEAASEEDVRSLSQTTLRTFTGIMRSLYDRAAHACLSHLVTLPVEDRSSWISENAPVERIVSDFREWSDAVADVALMAANQTLADARANAAVPGA